MPDSLGPLPKVHPRSEIVQRAEGDLMRVLIDWRAKHGLTLCEELALVNSHLDRLLWRAVATERKAASG